MISDNNTVLTHGLLRLVIVHIPTMGAETSCSCFSGSPKNDLPSPHSLLYAPDHLRTWSALWDALSEFKRMVWGTNELGKDELGNSIVRDPSSSSYSLLYARIELICLTSASALFQCSVITTLGKITIASTR